MDRICYDLCACPHTTLSVSLRRVESGGPFAFLGMGPRTVGSSAWLRDGSRGGAHEPYNLHFTSLSVRVSFVLGRCARLCGRPHAKKGSSRTRSCEREAFLPPPARGLPCSTSDAMACPCTAGCAEPSITFQTLANGRPAGTALFVTGTQELIFSNTSWPTASADLETYINGPPLTSYVKAVLISSGTCCANALSDSASPDYGSALAVAAGSTEAKVSLNLPAGTYKICVAFGRSSPPFSSGEYRMVTNAQLNVYTTLPPMPPSIPLPSSPPPAPPAVPLVYSPPSPPNPPFFPLFMDELSRGDYGISTCAFGPSSMPPPPALPPDFAPPPWLPPPPGTPPAPGSITSVQAMSEPKGCFTVGHIVLIGVFTTVACLVFCVICFCKRYLDSFNCGPRALASSLSAINNVPKNTAVAGEGKLNFGTSATNNWRGRVLVHSGCVCCCLLATSTITFAVVAATSSIFAGEGLAPNSSAIIL